MVAVAKKRVTILPEVANIPPERLEDSIIVIYGRKGIGKTSLAAQFNRSLVCMFESGRRNLPIVMVPGKDEPKLDWQTFKEYAEAFIESDKFDTLVVDTMDRAYDACLADVCRHLGCEHPQDKNDYGKTWNAVKDEFRAVMEVIKASGKGLVLLSHETPKPLNKASKTLKRDGVAAETLLERFEPSCSKQAFEVIQEICDYVFYYGYREEYRCITVRSPNDIVWTSCGMGEQFLDPDGTPISSFKVGNSPKDAYISLQEAYGNQLRDFDYEEPRVPKVFK